MPGMVDGLAKACSGVAPESAANESESNPQISHDEFGFDMQQAIAQRPQPRIAASIRAKPSSVIWPIDLNDEATGGSEKVDDVLAQHDLPAKRDPELTPGKPSPEPGFGERGLSTHDASAFVE
jgi:hypothetical protein